MFSGSTTKQRASAKENICFVTKIKIKIVTFNSKIVLNKQCGP